MEVDTTSDDYWPFPSKEFTLLYFLLNSPRPLVYDYVFMRTYTFSSNVIFSHLQGQSNLKFMWHVMKQLNSSIPSLSQVKNFLLPGLNLPQKVKFICSVVFQSYNILLFMSLFLQFLTSKGVPFYVNSLAMTLKKNLATPHIATNLQRFPVHPSGEMR